MIHKIVVSQFTKMLGNLSAILDKAAAFAEPKKIDMDVLLNARLAPDQFNLLRQIQIACDTAKLGAARAGGSDPYEVCVLLLEKCVGFVWSCVETPDLL